MEIEGGELNRPAGPPHDLLRVGREADPDAVAVMSAVRELTWRELETESTALAARYLELGLRSGDRLASWMPNRVDLVKHYLACFKAGLVATPLNYRYTTREVDHALEVSEASALLVHAERADELRASRRAAGLPLGTISYGGSAAGGGQRFEDLASGGAPDADLPAPDLSDPAAIFFTSGSTGPAKGVTHTHETLGWMFASAAAGLEATAADTILPASSMSHVGAFMWGLCTLAVGGRVVVARSYDAAALVPLLRAYQPTVLAMIPAALAALIRDGHVTAEDFASLRLCRAGADRVSAELLAEFSALAGFPIDEGYGMTEVGLATLNPPSGVIKQGSIGRPVGGFAVSLRPDGGDAPLPDGAVGRVWLRSRSRMVGYWRAPEATAAVVRDGWLDSGDLARADEDGYLWFFGRKKQVIVHDGSNISPLEVEGALMEHPAIAQAGVVGVHDLIHGEDVRAYVVLRPQASRPTSDELILHCRERVGYRAPEAIVFLDSMPLNPTGKVDRARLKRQAEQELHPHGLE